MKSISQLFAVILLAASVQAASIEGNIQLKYLNSAFDQDVFAKEFGEVVKATTSWRVGDFFGKETVFAGVSLKNTGSVQMYFQYYVAFYDKDKKLVGAIGQSVGSGLKPGAETQLASCLISLPKDRYKDIVSYQAVLYETDRSPEKKKLDE